MYPGGIDYVVVGQTVEDRPADLAVVTYNSAPCGESDPARVVGWESTYGFDTFFLVTNPDKTVRGVLVLSDEIHTAEGLRAGSSVDEILAVYGSSAVRTEEAYTDLYSVATAEGVLVFEVATERDREGGGAVGSVLWTLVLGAGQAPFSVYGTGYNSCH